jgi:hypothetical protein
MSGVLGFCHANAGVCTRLSVGFSASPVVARLRADVRVAAEQKHTRGVFSHGSFHGIAAGPSRFCRLTKRFETGVGLGSFEVVTAPGTCVPRRVKVDSRGSCHYSAAPSGDLCSALKRFFQWIGWETRRSVRTAGDTSLRNRLAGGGIGCTHSRGGIWSAFGVNARFGGSRSKTRGLTAHEKQLERVRFNAASAISEVPSSRRRLPGRLPLTIHRRAAENSGCGRLKSPRNSFFT